LFKEERLQCPTKAVDMHVRFRQIIMERVPCRCSSDSEGATAVRVQLKPWNNNMINWLLQYHVS